MVLNAQWIKPAKDMGDVVPLFFKDFSVNKEVACATLSLTVLGVYEASINGKAISNYVLAPGWTAYDHRLQVQTYDVTALIAGENTIEILLGKGWYRSRIEGWKNPKTQAKFMKNPAGLIAELTISYTDGTTETISTDESWKVKESQIRFSEIYDGEIYDATFASDEVQAVTAFDGPTHTLIAQEGEKTIEQERVCAMNIFKTPKGEIIVDFGQEVTGYVEINLTAKAGDIVDLSFAEVMDKEGNFYNENYRSALCQYHYTCKDGAQTYHPRLTFYGFRYIRLNQFPAAYEDISLDSFTAIVVQSELKRTGHLSCSDTMLNKLFSNIIWGQKCNYLDVPTDCPQRDERLGWTGDAQVFVKAGAYNFDIEKFFYKWLGDVAAEQFENGGIGFVVPDILRASSCSAAWGDATVICPWEIYLAYGNPEILRRQFESMKGWIRYITEQTNTPNLWIGGKHFGDWLGLDAPSGSYKGSSRDDLIASAYYAYSTSLLVKAGKVLGEDVSYYEELYTNIVKAFQETFTDYRTQTECVVAIHFNLAVDPQKTADQLAKMVIDAGTQLMTGFVGTPYLLHALSNYGYSELAYSLLFRKEYPSWLYSVSKGATTIWEHWDGIMENGDFWSSDMNSYNHYAYGSVADWVYGFAAGIKPVEEAPGYQKVVIAPHPDTRLDWLKASVDTRKGLVESLWKKADNQWRYEITTPVEATIIIDGKTYTKPAGTYYFYSPIK